MTYLEEYIQAIQNGEILVDQEILNTKIKKVQLS